MANEIQFKDGLTLDDAFVDEDESLVESSSYTISEVDSGDGSTSLSSSQLKDVSQKQQESVESNQFKNLKPTELNKKSNMDVSENQLLKQKDLAEFVEAKNLGTVLVRSKMNKSESDSESESYRTNSKQERAKKRKPNESDNESLQDSFSALVGSNKRRRMQNDEETKPKLKQEKLSEKELTKTNSYLKFNKSLEQVLKSVEDIKINEIPEDGVIQEKYLSSPTVIQELCTEAAKLKLQGALKLIPTDKLIKLLNVLELNIRSGDRVSPILDENKENVTTIFERVIKAVEACLVCFYVMTSSNMSKRVYIEEVIDRVVLYIKYHLPNTIFPFFDSNYRVDNKKTVGRKKKSLFVSKERMLVLYTKISELVNLLTELLNIQILSETSVMNAASIGVSAFSIQNINELQLACVKLVTTIFRCYETQRQQLLDDILASIGRLSNTKNCLRSFKLNGQEHIKMITGLVLQLVQCVVALPDNLGIKNFRDGTQSKTAKVVDKDVLICDKYETATNLATTFHAVFLNKCGTKSEDTDYRSLFENFVQNLLSKVNKPEWPASEVLLGLLGRILVLTFSNKDTDISLRVASLDYLGVVAAGLRRFSVLAVSKLEKIDQIIGDIKFKEIRKKHLETNTEEEKMQFLRHVLLDFLAVNAQNNETYKYARHFYISQWYKDVVSEESQLVPEAHASEICSKNRRSKRHKKPSDGSLKEKLKAIEEKKNFFLQKIPFQETISSGNRTYIDYHSAEIIAQYLASKRNFSQSFDLYLKAILIVLTEPSIAIRTKAMKCLTMIIEADPSVLTRDDVQKGVNHSILDQSTSVREATVDLLGKFVLSRPELIPKYYEMLSGRILDTGVSVRKRVIKILKDICLNYPDFSKIPEICAKIMRRVNDEEGIRRLVIEVFQNMWFTPTKDTKDTSLLKKVINITDVVALIKDNELGWFDQLLLGLFKPKEGSTEPSKTLVLAYSQIVDCLVENVLRLEETGSSKRLIPCSTSLFLFAKIRPQLLVKHASVLKPFLSLKCQSSEDVKIISNVVRIFELVVPLMTQPNQKFLTEIEESVMKLVLQQERTVVSACLSCLGAIINKLTRNYQLIRDCFKRSINYLIQYKEWLQSKNTRLIQEPRYRQYFRRALFTIGLLFQFFDFRNPEVIGDLPIDIKDRVFQLMIYFSERNDFDIQANTLKALGCICRRHYEFMLEEELKFFYHKLLTSEDTPLKMKVEVLYNIESYLLEEDNRMIEQDREWSKGTKKLNLKEMGEVRSGMASTIIQLYLKEILQSYLHSDLTVRQAVLRVIQLVLQQGLVHPVQIIPYLICMSTDCEKSVSHSADKELREINKKYPDFIHTKASLGVTLSYQLQKLLQVNVIVRGLRDGEPGEYPSALNGYLYTILRNSRQQRRALVLNMLKQFDDQENTTLSKMLYLADNLAYFSYEVFDEPFFIIHHIDVLISVSGANLLQLFREGLIIPDSHKMDIDNSDQNALADLIEDDDDEKLLISRLPEDTRELQACLSRAQGYLLLLTLRQHLKNIYGLSDSKIQLYSPSEAVKVYEKPVSRRSNALFDPKGTMKELEDGNSVEDLDEEGRKDLIRQYLDLREKYLQLG